MRTLSRCPQHPDWFEAVQSMLAEPSPSSYIHRYMASSGFPTAPAQLLPHVVHGKPPGGDGSWFCCAPDCDAWSRAVAMPVSGGSPRTVRSRLVITNIWTGGDSDDQLVGRTMPGRPSCSRALSIAVIDALTQAGLSS